MAVEEAAAPAWTCPLHWLQQYHDDNTCFQTPSLSWHRNVVNFEYITLEHKYTHPTVQHSNKILGVRAARFLSDVVGCLAVSEECHTKSYLNRTLENLLHPEDDCHKVPTTGLMCGNCLTVAPLRHGEAALHRAFMVIKQHPIERPVEHACAAAPRTPRN